MSGGDDSGELPQRRDGPLRPPSGSRGVHPQGFLLPEPGGGQPPRDGRRVVPIIPYFLCPGEALAPALVYRERGTRLLFCCG